MIPSMRELEVGEKNKWRAEVPNYELYFNATDSKVK